MSLEQPPIQEITTDPNTGRFPQVWMRWFDRIIQEIYLIDGGSP